MDKTVECILRRRMHGLYLTRPCEDIVQLSRELLGLHSWFYRNVAFSAVLRGARLTGWTTALTKTWLYRGTLHGVDFHELPLLLSLHADAAYPWLMDPSRLPDMAAKVLALMEDGVFSRAEMRRIFAFDLDPQTLQRVFSPWGGIFVYLARQGKVAFRDMKSRDFDLIDAEPRYTFDEALPILLERYFAAYGPATLADAALFLGLDKEKKQKLLAQNLDALARLEYQGNIYYYKEDAEPQGDIPALTLLSGFDPLVVSYADRSAILPPEYRQAVILKSGICQPSIAVDGRIAGIWNLKKRTPVVEFFTPQPHAIQQSARNLVEGMRWRTTGWI